MRDDFAVFVDGEAALAGRGDGAAEVAAGTFVGGFAVVGMMALRFTAEEKMMLSVEALSFFILHINNERIMTKQILGDFFDAVNNLITISSEI